MESLLTAPLVEKLLKDEIDVLISVDPMFNDDREDVTNFVSCLI